MVTTILSEKKKKSEKKISKKFKKTKIRKKLILVCYVAFSLFFDNFMLSMVESVLNRLKEGLFWICVLLYIR